MGNSDCGFKEKIISGVLKSGETVSTRIGNMIRDEGTLYLHGVDEGKAWSMVVTEETGNITMTDSCSQEGLFILAFE
jgi:hypothetical protein